MFKNLFLTFFLLFNCTLWSQDFDHPGKLFLKNDTISGSFSDKITSKTTFLIFKSSSSKQTLNVLSTDSLRLQYDRSRKTYITKKFNGAVQILELLTEGKATLYKSPSSSNFFIATKAFGIKELAQKNTRIETLGGVRGILSVTFNDCPEVRELVNSRSFSYPKIKELTLKYNNCNRFTEGYALSENQLKALEFSKKEGIFKLEIGAGYFFEHIEGRVLGQSFASNLEGVALSVSGNFSPSYFKALRNKLFFDLSATLHINASNRVLDKNSLKLFFSPRYNFLDHKKINPYLRLNLGISLERYTIATPPAQIALDFPPETKNSDTALNLGIEGGVTLNKKIRIGIVFIPQYNTQIVSETTDLDFGLRTKSLTIKASYLFGRQ